MCNCILQAFHVGIKCLKEGSAKKFSTMFNNKYLHFICNIKRYVGKTEIRIANEKRRKGEA